MNLYIPEIGDTIVLSKDWTFDLHAERRNTGLIKHFGHPVPRWSDPEVYKVTLPAGTNLKVDRIYIRKGISEYSSITFYATIGKNKIRFWAKLSDCNTIEFTKGEAAVNVKIEFRSWIPENRQSANPVYYPWMREKEGVVIVDYSDGSISLSQYAYRVISARQSEKVLLLESKFKVKTIVHEYRNALGIKRQDEYKKVDGVKHVLKDLNGNIIAESASIATIKKKAKEHVKSTL